MQLEITMNIGSFAVVALSLLLAITTCGIGFLIHRATPRVVRLTSPILLTLVVSLALLCYRIYFGVYLIGDEVSWHLDGLLVADYLNGQIASIEDRLSSGKAGYAWLVGLVYTVTGPAPIVLMLLNIFLSLLMIPIWVQITTLVGSQLELTPEQMKRSATAISYGLILAPVILFWSPRLLREIPSMFLIATALLFFLRFLIWRRYSSLILCIVAIMAMMSIRAQIGIGLVAALALSAVIVWSNRFRSSLIRIGVIGPAILFCLTVTWSVVRESADLSVENALLRSRALTNATSAFSGADELQSAGTIFEIVTFNLPRILFGPFPHELNFSSVMLLAAVSNVFWIAALLISAQVFVGSNSLERGQVKWDSIWVIVTFTLMLIAALSITAGNYGLVVRMRLMPFATLLPLAAIGFSLLIDIKPKKRRKTKIPKLSSSY